MTDSSLNLDITIGDDSISKSSTEPADAEKTPNETAGETGGRDPSEITNEMQPPAASPTGVALALVPESTVKEPLTLACSVDDDDSKQTKGVVAKEEGPANICPASGAAATADDKKNDGVVIEPNSGKNLIIVLHGRTKKKTATRPSFNLFLKQAADRAAWLSTRNTPKSSNTTNATRQSQRTRRNTTTNAARSSPALPMALSGKNSGSNGNGSGKRKRDPTALAMSVYESARKKQNSNNNNSNNNKHQHHDDNDSDISFRHQLMMNGGGGGYSGGDDEDVFEDFAKQPVLLLPSKKSSSASTKGSSKKSSGGKDVPNGFSQKKLKESQQQQQGIVVDHPRNTDVLLGRGSAIANTPGNVMFRQFVWDRKEAYRAAARNSKFHVATQLVNDIRNLHGGRFLEPSATLTTKSHIVWCEAPLHRAIEKSCQALRELKMKEPAPIVGVPLPTPTLLPRPSMEAQPQVEPQTEQTPPPTTTALITVTVGGTDDSPLKKNKSKTSSKTPSSKYPKMPPGPRPVIEKPRKNDVLFGRGSQIALHPGNVQFREIVWQEKDEYQRTRNAGIKRDVAMHVIGLVRELEPPGRFLELAGTSVMDGPWVESTPERILEKTSQALREQKWHWTQKAMATSAAAEQMIELDESLPTGGNEASSLPSSYPASVRDDSEEMELPIAMEKPIATPEVEPPTQQYVGEEAFQDKSQEEQMALLREGSRIAIYWPLDEVFYPATIDDSLQDNFFYVKYDDGESEWIDLTRNSFYTLKPLVLPRKSAPPAPRPKKKAARKTKPTTKPAPKTLRPKPKPSTSSDPTPPETASSNISIKPISIKPASKAKAKPASKAKPEPASNAKVKPASTTSTKAVSKPPTKDPTKTSTKAASKTSTKAAPTRTSIRAASKTSTKAASKTPPIKAAKTVVKVTKSAKKAAKSPPCGWSQRNKQIREGVAKYGTDNWEAVAAMVPDWSAEECQRRFAIELDPELSRELLTGKEVRQMMRYQSENGNVWVKLAFKMKRRATSFISEKWGRKIRRVAIEYVQKKTGLKVEKIEDPKTKKINYHGHFEGAYKAVMATHPF